MANPIGARRARVNGSGTVVKADGTVRREGDLPDGLDDFIDVCEQQEVTDDGTDAWDGDADGDVRRRGRSN